MNTSGFLSATLPSLIDTIEIRSRAHPPIRLKIADLLAEPKPGAPVVPPSPLMRLLKPTVIITGPAFPKPQVIAPAGPVGADAWKAPVIAVVGLAVVGGFLAVTTVFAIGKRSGHG